jgi:Glyoxalase-like domain
MTVVLDHLIVFCSVGAPEAEELVRLGLTEGSSNTHPGQGTACRRFFFSNAYLDLSWVSDPTELENETARRLAFRERWSGRLATTCPFGLVLRAATSANLDPPFRSWSYRPTYMPAGLAINVAEDVPLTEPALVHFGVAGSRATRVEPTTHALGVNRITDVSIDAPSSGPRSSAASAIESCGIVSLRSAERSLMTITFDAARRGASADLQPVMPLVLKW